MNRYALTEPKKWTQGQVGKLIELSEGGTPPHEIARIMGRSEVSINIKLKRLRKKDHTYNESHLADKYEANMEFFCAIRPKSVLDVFAGPESWYEAHARGAEVVTNDKETTYTTHYHEDAEKLLCKLYYENQKFDLIDLDPFGSAYDCFDLAVKMAKEALIITFGEMGHKRFKRLDFVRRYYGIKTMEDFTVENLIDEVIRIGERNKKKLTPVIIKQWRGIARVYFTITRLKITEQWDKRNEETHNQKTQVVEHSHTTGKTNSAGRLC